MDNISKIEKEADLIFSEYSKYANLQTEYSDALSAAIHGKNSGEAKRLSKLKKEVISKKNDFKKRYDELYKAIREHYRQAEGNAQGNTAHVSPAKPSASPTTNTATAQKNGSGKEKFKEQDEVLNEYRKYLGIQNEYSIALAAAISGKKPEEAKKFSKLKQEIADKISASRKRYDELLNTSIPTFALQPATNTESGNGGGIPISKFPKASSIGRVRPATKPASDPKGASTVSPTSFSPISAIKETFEGLSEVFKPVSEIWGKTCDDISKKTKPITTEAKKKLSGVFGVFKTIAKPIVKVFTTVFSVVKTIGKVIYKVFSAAGKAIGFVFKGVSRVFGIAGKVIGGTVGVFKSIAGPIAKTVGTVIGAISSIVKTTFKVIGTFFKVVSTVVSVSFKVITRSFHIIGAAIAAVVKAVMIPIKIIIGTIAKTFSAIVNVFKALASTIFKIISGLFTVIKTIVSTAFTVIKAVGGALLAIPKMIISVISNVVSALGGQLTKLLGKVMDAVGTIGSILGVGAIGTPLVIATTAVASNMAQAGDYREQRTDLTQQRKRLMKTAQFTGPTSDVINQWVEYSKQIADLDWKNQNVSKSSKELEKVWTSVKHTFIAIHKTIGDIITNGLAKIVPSAKDASDAIVKFFTPALSFLITCFKDFGSVWDFITASFDFGYSYIKETTLNLVKSISDSFSSITETLPQLFNEAFSNILTIMKNFFTSAKGLISAFTAKGVSMLPDSWQSAISKITKIFENFMHNLPLYFEAIENMSNSINDFINQDWTAIAKKKAWESFAGDSKDDLKRQIDQNNKNAELGYKELDFSKGGWAGFLDPTHDGRAVGETLTSLVTGYDEHSAQVDNDKLRREFRKRNLDYARKNGLLDYINPDTGAFETKKIKSFKEASAGLKFRDWNEGVQDLTPEQIKADRKAADDYLKAELTKFSEADLTAGTSTASLTKLKDIITDILKKTLITTKDQMSPRLLEHYQKLENAGISLQPTLNKNKNEAAKLLGSRMNEQKRALNQEKPPISLPELFQLMNSMGGANTDSLEGAYDRISGALGNQNPMLLEAIKQTSIQEKLRAQQEVAEKAREARENEIANKHENLLKDANDKIAELTQAIKDKEEKRGEVFDNIQPDTESPLLKKAYDRLGSQLEMLRNALKQATQRRNAINEKFFNNK